ncbi:MAG TPA: Hsp20/alpha crystallin family protein [Methanofastidiosum sp.]|nr:Hsp20/alpha crystallin family protein [Methanofastidiosum sp.]HQK62033.1 Hsp20/alpha crystallin family protein [Methanofastidiosum sp.]HQM94142.1 Hsp20/alpha crystallin family protein [Methanofastidiosum sp.]HQQ48051.1 Hsp20/alpha crystallin family protein [Methanofastidiosum sp.]
MTWLDIMEDMRKMQEEIERAFPEFWRRSPLLIPGESKEGELMRYRRPLTDLKETENEFIMELEMPGITKDDIDIKVTEDTIEIKAEKKYEQKEEDKEKGYFFQERKYQGFYRSIPLPAGIKPEETEAKFDNGILEITMKKTEEKEKALKVNVK